MEWEPSCSSPGSVLCPRWPFQDSNPFVETQLLVIELQPDPERPRDPSHSQNHYLQETGGGELYFSQPPLSPFKQPFWRWAPWKRTPSYFEKIPQCWSSPFSLSFVYKHVIPKCCPHLRYTKSHGTERFSRGGPQGTYSVTALKSWWAWGSCFLIENEYPSRSLYAPPPTSPSPVFLEDFSECWLHLQDVSFPTLEFVLQQRCLHWILLILSLNGRAVNSTINVK